MNNNSSPLKKKNIAETIISVLICIYFSTILIFSSNSDLLIYSQIAYVLAFGCCFVYLFNRKDALFAFKVDRYIVLLVLFVVYSFLSSMWAEKPDISIDRTKTIFQLVVTAIILYIYINYTQDTNSILKIVYISGLIGSLYIFLYYGMEEYFRMLEEGQRAGADINNVNSIGITAAVAFIIGFYYAYIKKAKFNYLLIILPGIMSLGSGSRKALVMVVLGALLIIFFDYKKNSMQYKNKINIKNITKLLAFALLIIVLLIALSKVSYFSTAFERFSDMLGRSGGKDSSTLKREEMISAGLESFLSKPFFGIGIGNSFVITIEEFGYATYLHNNFVELLACVGIVGFVLYYSIYVYLIANLYKIFKKNQKPGTAVILILILIWLIMDFGAVSYYSKMTYIYFTIAAAEVHLEKNKIMKKEYGSERE